MDIKSIAECKKNILDEMKELLQFQPGSNDRYRSFRAEVYDRKNGHDAHTFRKHKKEFAQFSAEDAMKYIEDSVHLYRHEELVKLLVNLVMNYTKQR